MVTTASATLIKFSSSITVHPSIRPRPTSTRCTVKQERERHRHAFHLFLRSKCLLWLAIQCLIQCGHKCTLANHHRCLVVHSKDSTFDASQPSMFYVLSFFLFNVQGKSTMVLVVLKLVNSAKSNVDSVNP